MHCERVLSILSVELLRSGEERQGSVRSGASMLRILKDGHESIAGSFINIAAGGVDEIEKRGKIAFHLTFKGLG